MKNYLLAILSVLLISLVLAKNFSRDVEASQSTAQKWEYRTVEANGSSPPGPHPTESFGKVIQDPSGLNGWGREGWELISVVKHTDSYSFIFYFKRPLK
jgi:hypothetical protein